MGENDQAIDTLQQLLAVPASGGAISPAVLKLDPSWDAVREDPRFQTLLAEHANEIAIAQPAPP